MENVRGAEAVVAVLDELIWMFTEYELPFWAAALAADRLRVLAGDDDAYPIIRYRLNHRDGLSQVWVAFGDRDLNRRLDVLRSSLSELTVEEPAEVEKSEPLSPPEYGERTVDDPGPDPVFFARDFVRGTLLDNGDGTFLRSTWTILWYDEHLRFRPVVRVWKHCVPVSVEEYRSIRAACYGWWITLFGTPAAIVGIVLLGVPEGVYGFIAILGFILMTIAAYAASALERKRSGIVGLWSEKTGQLQRPISRGSRVDRDDRED
jgi:hypothetical protein